MKRVLIVEDERGIAEAIGEVAARLGHEYSLCGTLSEGRDAIALGRFDAAILDIGLPDGKGLQLLPDLAQSRTSVAVITARGDLGDAVLARREGAEIYLPKPLKLQDVEQVLDQLLRSAEEPGEEATDDEAPGGGLLGKSPAMQRVYALIAQASASEAVVLIRGETGSGKTAAAGAIHRHSRRADMPFQVLHCQALPEALLESELFGYERGAFTGALGTRRGLLEVADGGTVLLDEIGDLPAAAQAKLLRVLEEGVLMRVGGRAEIRVDLRILAATHQDLADRVKSGQFREDLYYRLRVIELQMPSLRERPEDIPVMAESFLKATGRSLRFSEEVLSQFRYHPWPGNVRELRNAVQASAAACNGRTLMIEHLPGWLTGAEPDPDSSFGRLVRSRVDAAIRAREGYKEISEALERELLVALLERFQGRPTIMARELGMNRVTLRSRLRILGISPGGADGNEPDLGSNSECV